ncbi:MAG: hypothetical protein CMJ96_10025 [Planctomycetes bacterium]|nr:hypothetical protein [Planctomycetota bacterium]
MTLRATFICLLALSCTKGEGSSSAPEKTAWTPVLQARLEQFQGQGLPPVDEGELQNVRELLESSRLGGRLGKMAQRSLDDFSNEKLCSILLDWVEDRFDNSPLRLRAYPLLRERAVPEILPRLLLRLKYEKDLSANIAIAATLLQLGNGAGLQALQNILLDSTSDERVRTQALLVLNATPGFESAKDFEDSWQLLSAAIMNWSRFRTFGKPTVSPPSVALQAETWNMIARLQSQPLRPVDDARFVLSRMRGELSIPPLLEATRDSSIYVREHALQTLAWMGYTVGEWDLRTNAGFVQKLTPLLAHAVVRPRVFEALASSGSPEAANLAVEWLQKGNYQTATAAADCLLRCAHSLEHFQAARDNRSQEHLSPEARWSLYLLVMSTTEKVAPLPSLILEQVPEGERTRRSRWSALRAQMPMHSRR